MSAVGRERSPLHRIDKRQRQELRDIAGLGVTVRNSSDSGLLRRSITRFPRLASADRPFAAVRARSWVGSSAARTASRTPTEARQDALGPIRGLS